MRSLIRSLSFIVCFSLFTEALAASGDFVLPGERPHFLVTPNFLAQPPLFPNEELILDKAPITRRFLGSGDALEMGFPTPALYAAWDVLPEEPPCGECLEKTPPPSVAQNKERASAELKKIFSAGVWEGYLYVKETAGGKLARRVPLQRTINAIHYKPKVDETQRLRDLWAKTLGVDIWYPYFQVKKVERWVKEKCSFKIFKMKCKPRIEKGLFTYICRKTF